MLDLIRMGGVPIWFVLATGGLTVAFALRFAGRPRERTLAQIRPLSLATLMIAVAGSLAGIGLTLRHARSLVGRADGNAILLTGIGESSACVTLGLGLLAVAWVMVALGLRRQD